MLGSSKAVFANLGDSRGAQFVVRSEDMPGTVVFATHDHKPSRFDEANRIAKAGGKDMLLYTEYLNFRWQAGLKRTG